MSNKQNSKRFLHVEMNPSFKKKKSSEQLIETSNVSTQIDIINLTDELNDSDQTISSDNMEEEIKRSHTRKTASLEWFKDYPWLEANSTGESTILYCKLCRDQNGKSKFAKGTSTLRLEGIRRHLRTSEHKKSVELAEAEQIQTNTVTMYQPSKKKLSIISLLMDVYYCSKHNLSLNIYPDLCNLISLQIKNINNLSISDNISTLKSASLEKSSLHKSKYGSYTNPKAGFEFLDSISYVIRKTLFEEFSSSIYWSIMIDETNSIDNDKYLAVVSKYFVNNIPCMRYLGMINLDSTDSENIYNQIILFCISNEISYQNLIHFGSDGASNMIGIKIIFK
jgi:Domain of unknown function (DUF4371)